MRSASYRFANILWIDHLVDQRSFRKSAVRLVIFATIPWLSGLLIALSGGYESQYLITPAFYVGSAGILLASSVLAYGSARQYSMYERFLSCFDVNDESRQASIREALARHSNFYHHMRASLIVFCICGLAAAAGSFFWSSVSPVSRFFGTYLPRFEAFYSYGWYEDAIRVHGFFIIMIFSLFISFPLGTSASIILRLPTFLWKASSQTPLLPPSFIKMHFNPVATFYATVSIFWLAGVVLMLFFLGQNKDWPSLIVVIFTFLLGIINFTLPQIAYARVVSASEERFLGALSKRFRNRMEESTIRDDREPRDIENMPLGVENFAAAMSLLKHDRWVYPIHQTYFVVGAYLFSAVSWGRLFPIFGLEV